MSASASGQGRCDRVEARLGLNVPEERELGVFANMLSVWHTEHEFTLDFAVYGPVVQTDEGPTVSATVVSRIKVPTSVIFLVAKAIADNVDNYEHTFGNILTPRAGEKLFPPEEGAG
ncbi:hypothetical protein BH18ACT4_BH18ACT4_10390 [soil metagenome]